MCLVLRKSVYVVEYVSCLHPVAVPGYPFKGLPRFILFNLGQSDSHCFDLRLLPCYETKKLMQLGSYRWLGYSWITEIAFFIQPARCEHHLRLKYLVLTVIDTQSNLDRKPCNSCVSLDRLHLR